MWSRARSEIPYDRGNGVRRAREIMLRRRLRIGYPLVFAAEKGARAGRLPRVLLSRKFIRTRISPCSFVKIHEGSRVKRKVLLSGCHKIIGYSFAVFSTDRWKVDFLLVKKFRRRLPLIKT